MLGESASAADAETVRKKTRWLLSILAEPPQAQCKKQMTLFSFSSLLFQFFILRPIRFVVQLFLNVARRALSIKFCVSPFIIASHRHSCWIIFVSLNAKIIIIGTICLHKKKRMNYDWWVPTCMQLKEERLVHCISPRFSLSRRQNNRKKNKEQKNAFDLCDCDHSVCGFDAKWQSLCLRAHEFQFNSFWRNNLINSCGSREYKRSRIPSVFRDAHLIYGSRQKMKVELGHTFKYHFSIR